MAEEGEAITVEALLRRHGIRHAQLPSRAVGLIRKGLVDRPDRGRLAFTTPLGGEFLRRVVE